ncbi:Fe-S cluster assembly protein HesB [Humibacter ginsenosidimutans]|uniref:Fe-S cluster assembly protein HesB n=1 Tax=Humibacter ginsenosidimutans TaxID=2599293 RepID=A0A5B8M7H4_9MICO|nr:Fe-S cluster assembly protein HesB [Humibacter ginsenosidimutans]QDZ15954.1 Fe-S cluster assembly protein HesB [Humibacter ginsenosidimutans]
MLTLTDNASTIVKTLTAQAVDSPDGGLRITNSDTSDTAFSVSVTPAPDAHDQVISSGDARVFVDENASALLADKELDAQLDEQGAVHFALGLQSQ